LTGGGDGVLLRGERLLDRELDREYERPLPLEPDEELLERELRPFFGDLLTERERALPRSCSDFTPLEVSLASLELLF